jgi:hypothetical protein
LNPFRPSAWRRYAMRSRRLAGCAIPGRADRLGLDRLGLEVRHGGGDAIDRLLTRLYATPQTMLERVEAIAQQPDVLRRGNLAV